MSLQPGSALWLLRHELRMFLHTYAGKLNKQGKRGIRIGSIALWLVLFGIIQFAAYFVVRKIGGRIDHLPPEAAMGATLVLFAAATLMMAMGLRTSVEALFERNDLDLLMSSPLPTRSIFTVRLAAVVIAIAAVYMFFLTPFANAGLVLGHFRWTGIYPTIISMAMLAGSLSMLLTLGLVRMIGVRRTRVTAQVLGALSGAFIFLCVQASNAGLAPARDRMIESILPLVSPGGALDVNSWIWVPGRALLGSAWPALAMFAAGCAAVMFTIGTTHRFFALGVQQAAGANRTAKRPAGGTRFHFRRGLLVNIALKEWRSTLRDPHLISQMLLQLLYLVPLFAVIFVKNDRPLAGIAAGLCFFMSSLTGSLAWLTVAAEDAPDLLKAAPVEMRRIRRAKVMAVIIPPLVLSAPVLGWAIAGQPWQGLQMALAVAGAIVSTALIVLWTSKPAPRSSFARRAKGNLLGMLLELLNTIGWAGGTLATLMPYGQRYDQDVYLIAMAICGGLVLASVGLAWMSARMRGPA